MWLLFLPTRAASQWLSVTRDWRSTLSGTSSLSFAIAGYFKLKIDIASLNSPTMNEENLGNLFADLPKKCLVLLGGIDTAGLTTCWGGKTNRGGQAG
jgi:hypothetical protein